MNRFMMLIRHFPPTIRARTIPLNKGEANGKHNTKKRREWGSVIIRRDTDGNPTSFQTQYVNPLDLSKKVGRNFSVYGQINVYGVTTKSERHKRSYWTRTADGNGIGGRKAPVPYGS